MGIIDCQNSPSSSDRHHYDYQPRYALDPLVSIITSFQAEANFDELLRCVRGMSLVYWEWLVIGAPKDLIARLQQVEPRVREFMPIGQGSTWQCAIQSSKGRYIFKLDSSDQVEPTFVEKCIWFLETHANFAFCNSYWIACGAHEYLVSEGFERGIQLFEEHSVPGTAVLRREACEKLSDEAISLDAEGRYLWLAFAELGLWGYTLPQHLIWTRQPEALPSDQQVTRTRIAEHLASLAGQFPRPERTGSTMMNTPYTGHYDVVPFANPLAQNQPRVLFLIPSLAIGGAENVMLDWSRFLIRRGWEVSFVVIESRSDDLESEFLKWTPDVFHLMHVADPADYGRFLRYLIDSRQFELVVFAIGETPHFVPYLRAYYPDLVFISYSAGFVPSLRHGPALGANISLQSMLNLSIVLSHNLESIMVAHQADPHKIAVCYPGLDPAFWDPAPFDRAALRAEFEIDQDIPVVLFVARMAEEKRPVLVVDIVHRLEQRGVHCLCVMVGDGPRASEVRRRIEELHVQSIRLVGAQPHEVVRRWTAISDCCVLPSQRESLGLVLLEAMVMEVVPVASAADGPLEILTPEVGFTVPFGADEVERFADILQHLFENPVERKTMGRQGRRFVLEQFTLAHAEAQLFAALEKAKTLKVATTLNPDIASTMQLEFSELQYYVGKLEAAKIWFQGQIGYRDQRIAELEAWLSQVEDGKAWLEGQVHNWQHAAEEQAKIIQELQAQVAELLKP